MILMSPAALTWVSQLGLSAFELNQSQALAAGLALPHPSGYRWLTEAGVDCRAP